MISLLVGLVLMGVALWCFNAYVVTIDPAIKKLINAVVILFALLYVAAAFGLFSGFAGPVVIRRG